MGAVLVTGVNRTHRQRSGRRESQNFPFSAQVDVLFRFIVRSITFIIGLLILGLWGGIVRAETFKLNNGESVTGEVLTGSAIDQGVQIKLGEGEYRRVPWSSFSQEDLKNFAKNQKMQPFVEPFIEITQEEKIKRTEVNLKPPPKLERPAPQSLFGALFSSTLGIVVVLAVYAANIYAGYEVAVFRAQPPLMVCGLSAIPGLGFAAPIVFLAMRTRIKAGEAYVEEPEAAAGPEAASSGAPATASPAAAVEESVNPMQGTMEHPTALRLHTEATEHSKASLPKPVVYQRGQFTFNRRFFETKFPGFFGAVRREVDKDMVLIIKSARGEYVGQRISRIAANDLHLEIHRGGVTEEVQLPFQEIQEIRLQHQEIQ